MELSFISIGISQMTLWHRPQNKDIFYLQELQKITLIVTLLSAKEDPKNIIKECEELGIKNVNIQLNGANQALLTNRDTVKMLKKALSQLYVELASVEHRVLVHCAAGVHRTGTIAYTLQRLDGKEPKEAFEGLGQMRKETYQGVGDWRIELAEKSLYPEIRKAIEQLKGATEIKE